MDTKKKELLGLYANGGKDWRPQGDPERVNVRDFADPALGEHAKAIPYGIYDIGNDEGWVSVGDVADTSEFAVEAIRRWWNSVGKARFPKATTLTITADAGGSNGYRVRAWKWHLAKLAAETGLAITVRRSTRRSASSGSGRSTGSSSWSRPSSARTIVATAVTGLVSST